MSAPHWSTWVEDFCRSLEQRGCAPTTCQKVRGELGRWKAFCALHQLEPAQVCQEHLLTFQQALSWQRGERGPLSPNTQTAACDWCRRMLRWGFAQGWLWHDPTAGWKLQWPAPAVLKLPDAGQLATLLAIPDSSPFGLRDRAILETLYGCGLRRAECHALDLDDLRLRERTLKVRRGKGARPRLVPVGERLAEALLCYLEQGRPQLQPIPGQTALFLSRRGERLSFVGYQRLVRRALRQAGIDQRITPHTLRHAFATHLLQEGAPIQAVSALLGHALLTSTQRYAHLTPQDLLQEHRRTHPREESRP